jgi:hypothetical protein
MIIIWRKLIMAKLFLGAVKVDDQVTEFDMSGLTAGKLTLPTGAIKSLTEISSSVLLGTGNMPQQGGGKLIQEKHLVDSIDFAEQGRQAIQADVDANEAAALAGRQAIQADVDQNEADADASFVAATSDRGLIRTEFAAADSALETSLQAYADQAEADAKADAAFNLAAEAVIARAAELANANAISAEETRALGQEAAIRSEFAAADAILTAARVAGDQALQDQFDTLLAGSSVDLDTLLELVTAYELADTDIVASIVALQADVDGNESDADASFVAATSDRALIRSEFAAADATETAARIAGDALQAQNLASEEAARIAADGVATSDRAAIRSEFAAADSAEQTARIAADGVLQSNIDSEAATRLANDNTLQANITSEETARIAGDAATLVSAKAYTDAREAAEAALRLAADTTLQSNIDAEEARAVAAEGVLTADLAAEVANRISAISAENTAMLAAVAGVQADVDQNESDADAAISAEEARAIAAEGVLTSNLASEITNRTNADAFEANLSAVARAAIQADVDQNEADSDASHASATTDRGAIRSEFAAADAAEAALRVSGDAALQSQLDALLAGSSVDLDTLIELVTAYELADTSIIASITALQSDVDQNESDADAAIAAMDVAYKAADVVLQEKIDDEEARATAAEAVLSAAISAEEARALLAEGVLTSNLASEITNRTNADAFEANLSAVARAAIQADVDQNEADADAAIAAEQARAVAAEGVLTSDLAAEVTRASGEEIRIEGKFDDHFEGKVEVAYLTETSSAMGSATHYIVNASTAKSFTVPTMTESYFIMVKVAEGSESVTFNAGTGESFDGETDGNIVLHGGASVMMVKKGGVMYLF